MSELGELMTELDETGEDWEGHNPPAPPGAADSSLIVSPLADRCVSSVKVGQEIYWCEVGPPGHDGLCRGADPWGGHCEWRWWLER